MNFIIQCKSFLQCIYVNSDCDSAALASSSDIQAFAGGRSDWTACVSSQDSQLFRRLLLLALQHRRAPHPWGLHWVASLCRFTNQTMKPLKTGCFLSLSFNFLIKLNIVRHRRMIIKIGTLEFKGGNTTLGTTFPTSAKCLLNHQTCMRATKL